MFYSKTFKKLKNINEFLVCLTGQPPDKGIIRGKKHKNSIHFRRVKGTVPAITVCDDNPAYKKGDLVSLSCYYNKSQLSFQTEILGVTKNRITIKKPTEITLKRQRVSERYAPDTSDNIQFIIPSINKIFKPLNIGIQGICITSEENLWNNGLKFSQCILKTDRRDFYVDCIFRNWLNDINGYWKFGIEFSFSDSISFFHYLEWIYSLLLKETYSPPGISPVHLRTCINNTMPTFITKETAMVKDAYNEIESWGEQGLIGPLHCNITCIKNEKLVFACSAKRIYNNTFFAQQLVCIPGPHLYETPEVTLYGPLLDILLHHPSCKYLIICKSRDIEWYERFFNEVVLYAKDPSDVHITRLNFIDISINIENSRTVNSIKKPFLIQPLLNKEEFFDFAYRDLPAIINNSHNYSGSPKGTDLISDLLNTAGHSKVRKIYKITKNKNIIAAFAVCEVFSDGYLIDNSLDICRIFYCTDIKNHSMLLSGIIDELSLFYMSYQKTRFRIILENRKVNIKRITAFSSQLKGTLLRLIVSKQGLFSLNQAGYFSRGKFTKFFNHSYPQQSKRFPDNFEASNKKKKYIQISNEPLFQQFQDGKLEGVTSAAVSYISEFVPELIGINRNRICGEWFENSPMWCSVLQTHWGRVGIIVIPVFGDELYNNLKNIVNETVRALKIATRIGARTVSLTGLIPSATNYGRAITEAVAHRDDYPIISTGHAATCASVVLAIDKILTSGGCHTSPEKVAFIGLGSIGLSTLFLMMKSILHPKELILCEPYMEKTITDKIKYRLISDLEFHGKISFVSPKVKYELPSEIYSANLIVGATNVPNILDIKKIRPGTMIVDDSAPHCFDPVSAIQRFKENGDILFTEGGFLKSPHPINQLIYHPSFLNRTIPLLEQDPFNITGCVFSSLLSSKFDDLKPTIGLVDVDSSMKHYLKLKELGFKGAELHCCDLRRSAPFLLPREMIRRFQQRFGEHA